ncbi:MAG: pilus assembly protein TadG-related protein [Pseudomonadota bacterium]
MPKRTHTPRSSATGLWLLCWLTLGGIAVDSSHAYRQSAMLQATADAAALAGAQALGADVLMPFGAAPVANPLTAETAVTERVREYVAKNLPASAAVPAPEVKLGTWSADAERFLPGALPYDAVQVRFGGDRASESGVLRSVLVLVQEMAGFRSLHVSVESTASLRSERMMAFATGCVADDGALSPGEDQRYDRACLHGERAFAAGRPDPALVRGDTMLSLFGAEAAEPELGQAASF